MKRLILIIIMLFTLLSCTSRSKRVNTPTDPFTITTVVIIKKESNSTLYQYKLSGQSSYTYIYSKQRFYAGDTVTLIKIGE